ncbi:MAG: signal peptidase I [Candidatus Omnitrophica bacterium]|nr:signal peptidase I [Candidatus Omnitrophota bacterium]
MRIYRIFEHPDKGRRAVKEGFSWPAYFFSPFWALFKGLWLISFATLFLIITIQSVLYIGDESVGLWWKLQGVASSFILGILFGVFGNHWVCEKWNRKGFILLGKVEAITGRAAIERSRVPDKMIHRGVSRSTWVGSILVALAFNAISFIFAIVFASYYIPSPSMMDTLRINDRVFVNQFAYLNTPPRVGDLVVFNVPEDIPNIDPEKPVWIKRVVGVGGDRVSIVEGRLHLNGKPVEEPEFFRINTYRANLHRGDPFQETLVPEGELLLFGDNSANSYDGRYWGTVPEENLIGKVVFRFWPISRFGTIRGESVRPLEP